VGVDISEYEWMIESDRGLFCLQSPVDKHETRNTMSKIRESIYRTLYGDVADGIVFHSVMV